MPIPDPQPGLVISYAYLWHDESEKGRIEGVKDRPCALLLATTDQEEGTEVFVLPITHTPPIEPDSGLEIPAKTRVRLGLDNEPSWVITTELNKFRWPGPDIRKISRDPTAPWDYGFLPPKLFEQIKEQVLENSRKRRIANVTRTE